MQDKSDLYRAARGRARNFARNLEGLGLSWDIHSLRVKTSLRERSGKDWTIYFQFLTEGNKVLLFLPDGQGPRSFPEVPVYKDLHRQEVFFRWLNHHDFVLPPPAIADLPQI